MEHPQTRPTNTYEMYVAGENKFRKELRMQPETRSITGPKLAYPLTKAVPYAIRERSGGALIMAAEELLTWLRAVQTHVGSTELQWLTRGGPLRSFVQFALGAPRNATQAPDGLHARDPEFVRVVMDATRVVGERYFGFRAQGLGNVPSEGRALLVGSHNGGVVTTDSYLTLLALWDHFGPSRAVHPLAHDLIFQDPQLASFAARFGALPAHPEQGTRALENDRLVLVYPGADLDASRPWKDRYKVELAGRKGFIRLALRSRAPVIPVVSVGTHEQFIVLTRGTRIAKALQMQRWLRSSAFPIVFAFPWGITFGGLPYLPFPAQTSIAFGAPVRWPHLPREAADDPAIVSQCYEEVVQAMQQELDALSKNRIPFLGDRLRSQRQLGP